MKVVYKYDVPIVDLFDLVMPRDAEILHVAEQQPGKVQLWALVVPERRPQKRTFRLAGTGHGIEEPVEGRHVASFLMHKGGLVFHLFDLTGRA